MTIVTLAQPPQKMSYQTVIRNATDDLVSNTTVGIQISVLQGTSSGTAVYVETHAPMTNANGLASLEIGGGIPVTATMDAIDWGTGPYFLKSELDINGGTNYTLSLVSELLSVPYALHAFSSGDGQWSESGDGINTSNNAVGINSASPEHTLDVRSTSQAAPAGLNLSNDDKSRNLRFFSGSEEFPDPSMTWAPGHNLRFATFDDNTFDFSEKMQISAAGDVGIGIFEPEAKLDILGGDWNLDAGNAGDLRIGNATNNFRIGIATGGGGAGITRMYTNSNALILGANDVASLILEPNGEIKALSLTNTLIESGGDKSLVTKEYIAALEATITALEPQPAAIGDIREGGVVFWVNSTGLHGLVCAFADYAGTREWGCYPSDLPTVPNVTNDPPYGLGAEIGDGYNSNNDILKDCSSPPAALAARSYGLEWFLPSAKELYEMYINKSTLESIDGFSPFSDGFYWSSTEYNDLNAWLMSMQFGSVGPNFKDYAAYVRAVRAF